MVDSLNGCSFGALPHISQKPFELSPPRAHFNPSPTVILIGFAFWIRATFDHPAPSVVGQGCCVANGSTMSLRIGLIAEAATTFRSHAKPRTTDNCFAAAIAQAQPERRDASAGSLMASELNYDQATEALT
jgi:hypothetical protein